MARATATNDVEAIYRQDRARLWRSVYGFSGDEEVASDAVAEAFAQALGRGDAIRDVQAWIWRAAFRLAAGQMKDRSRFTHGPIPQAAVDDDGSAFEMLDALQRLTAQQRTAIVLHYYADFPVAEISRRTGMNQLAVRAHLSRGRKRLRTLLEMTDD